MTRKTCTKSLSSMLMSMLLFSSGVSLVGVAAADTMMKDDKGMMEQGKEMMKDDKAMMDEGKGMMKDDKAMMEEGKEMMKDDKAMMDEGKGMMKESMKQ